MSAMCPCTCWLSHDLLCDPMDCSPPGSSVHGISQAIILEWVAISFSRRSSQPRDKIQVPWGSCIGRRDSLPLSPPGEAPKMYLSRPFLKNTQLSPFVIFMVERLLVSHSLARQKNDLFVGMRGDWQVPHLPAACHMSQKCGRVRPWWGTRENADGVVYK